MSQESQPTPAGRDQPGQQPQPSQGSQAGTSTSGSWPLANLDYANTRATKNSKINAETVQNLGIAWKFPIPGTGAFGTAASNPVVVDNVVYFQDLASNVFALALADGKVKWKKIYNQTVVGPNGPGVGDQKVYAHVGPDEMKAIDINSGEEVWSTKLPGPSGSHQPLVYNRMVFTGVTVGTINEKTPAGQISLRAYAGGYSGHAFAVDTQSGKIDWDFKTVTEDFWGNKQINSGGGVWYPPAIDTQSGLTFWGTGNPAPFPGTKDFPNGSSRPGKNLYTCCVIALDHKSGELKWYNQLLEHDLYDHDAQISPVLGTARMDGKEREIVIGGGKLGEVVAIDRNTGETLWRVKVGKHVNDQLEKLPMDQVVEVYPGILGGVETPMALSDGVLYVPVVNLLAPYSATGYDAKDGVEATLTIEGKINYTEGNGEMIAIDISTGIVLWDKMLPGLVFGAATVINDLVFTSTYDGMVYALSTKDGSEVWSHKMPGGINGFPAVAGDTLLIPVGMTGEPFLYALRLNAGEKLAATPKPEKDKTSVHAGFTGGKPEGEAVTQGLNLSQEQQQLIEQGHQIYLKYGARCHQPNGKGVAEAIPHLADSQFVTGNANQVIHMVLYGEGAMPAWGNVLDNQQVAAVVSYIRNAWGNQADTVTADQVQQVKNQNKNKDQQQEQAKNKQDTPGSDKL